MILLAILSLALLPLILMRFWPVGRVNDFSSRGPSLAAVARDCFRRSRIDAAGATAKRTSESGSEACESDEATSAEHGWPRTGLSEIPNSPTTFNQTNRKEKHGFITTALKGSKIKSNDSLIRPTVAQSARKTGYVFIRKSVGGVVLLADGTTLGRLLAVNGRVR